MPGAILTATKVGARYGASRVLWNVDLHVLPGEIVTLLGANGAGKTTFLHTVMGLVQMTSGRVFHGCNVENASFGLTTCAERTAVFTAVSEGERDFVAIAVTAREGRGAPPCGSCRQVLHEFAPAIWVYWRDAGGRILKRRLRALLPKAFVLKRGRR